MGSKDSEEIEKIAEDIFNRKTRDYPRSSGYVKQRRKKVMIPYLQLQTYADYPFTISNECISCGLCSRVCPCSNITMTNGKPTFQHHCANCMACVASCPKRAIGYVITQED